MGTGFRPREIDEDAPRRCVSHFADLVLTFGVIGDMALLQVIAASLKDVARLMKDEAEASRKARHAGEDSPAARDKR